MCTCFYLISLFKIYFYRWACQHMPLILALRGQKQSDLSEFEASLVYRDFQDSQGYTRKLSQKPNKTKTVLTNLFIKKQNRHTITITKHKSVYKLPMKNFFREKKMTKSTSEIRFPNRYQGLHCSLICYKLPFRTFFRSSLHCFDYLSEYMLCTMCMPSVFRSVRKQWMLWN